MVRGNGLSTLPSLKAFFAAFQHEPDRAGGKVAAPPLYDIALLDAPMATIPDDRTLGRGG